MYKKICFLLILLFLITLLPANTKLNVKYSLQYDNNLFNLSENDINRYKNGLAYSYIESSDDLVNIVQLGVSDVYRFKGIRFAPFIRNSFTANLNNSDKNSWSLLLGSNNRWNNLRFNLSYGYYPNNYVRKYRDTDGTNSYEKFDYFKMMYRFTGSYSFHDLIHPQFYIKYEYYHHNKYFTEYDAPALTTGIGWRLNASFITTDLFYYFRTYNTESKHQQIQYIIDNEKDASYDSNIYEIKMRTKRFYSILTDYRLYMSYKLEDRYFKADFPLIIDPFHVSRNDIISTINIGSDLWFVKNLNFNLDLKYTFRNVNSDYETVIKSKEYEKFQISTSIEWNFDLFN